MALWCRYAPPAPLLPPKSGYPFPHMHKGARNGPGRDVQAIPPNHAHLRCCTAGITAFMRWSHTAHRPASHIRNMILQPFTRSVATSVWPSFSAMQSSRHERTQADISIHQHTPAYTSIHLCHVFNLQQNKRRGNALEVENEIILFVK